ncbi:MAG: hypothetical protein A3A81_02725 [Omnitrophica bacterium RIFCSPLOWO2_01_FULL_45_10b]|nr:MAG: hypothetical protein A3A81_02725 [Omnitrophica bacterium RIFCSPLOWO2_01_FULL_45_10b]
MICVAEMKKIRPIKYKFKHSLHDIMEYVRLNPEAAARKIKEAKVNKAMQAKQISEYRYHMVLMLDYDVLKRFDRAIRQS